MQLGVTKLLKSSDIYEAKSEGASEKNLYEANEA